MNRRQFFKRAAIVAAGAAAAPLVRSEPEAPEAVAESAEWPPESLSDGIVGLIPDDAEMILDIKRKVGPDGPAMQMSWSVNGQNVAYNTGLGDSERSYARGLALKLYRLTLRA